MIIGVFKSRVNPNFTDEFNRLYDEMSGHIAKIKGYNGHKMYKAEDGEACVVVEFENDEAFEQWDKHVEHKKAKQRGKQEVFDAYDVMVGKVFERHTKPAPAEPFIPPYFI